MRRPTGTIPLPASGVSQAEHNTPRMRSMEFILTQQSIRAVGEARGINAGQIGGAAARAARGAQLSLRQLAKVIGASPSLLSQIENGKVTPIGRHALPALARALGGPGRRVLRRCGASRAGRRRQAPGSCARSDRQRISLEHGVTWENLLPHEEPGMRFMEIHYAPGAHSGEHMLRHPGRDLFVVLEGELTSGWASREHRLPLATRSASPTSSRTSSATTGRWRPAPSSASSATTRGHRGRARPTGTELRRDPRPWVAPRSTADGRGGLRRRHRTHRTAGAADRSGHCDAPCRDPCRRCVGSASHPPASCHGYESAACKRSFQVDGPVPHGRSAALDGRAPSSSMATNTKLPRRRQRALPAGDVLGEHVDADGDRGAPHAASPARPARPAVRHGPGP